MRWQDRTHFFALSANLMRRILVDYARSRNYQKRGGGVRPVALNEDIDFSPGEKHRPGSARRLFECAGGDRSAQKQGGRTEVFRRADHTGNCEEALGSLGADRIARLEAGQVLAPAGNEATVTREGWQQIEKLYHLRSRAADLPSAQQYLAISVCRGRNSCEVEVESLLRHGDEAHGMLDGRALEVAARPVRYRSMSPT